MLAHIADNAAFNEAAYHLAHPHKGQQWATHRLHGPKELSTGLGQPGLSCTIVMADPATVVFTMKVLQPLMKASLMAVAAVGCRPDSAPAPEGLHKPGLYIYETFRLCDFNLRRLEVLQRLIQQATKLRRLLCDLAKPWQCCDRLA